MAGTQPRGVPEPETPQDTEREAAQGLRIAELRVSQALGADATADHQQLVGGRKRELTLDRLCGAGEPAIAASAAAGLIGGVHEAPRPRRGTRHAPSLARAASRCATSHLGGRPRRGRESSKGTRR